MTEGPLYEAQHDSPGPSTHEYDLQGPTKMRVLHIRRNLSDDTGFIMPTAIIVLLVLTLLTGVAISVAMQTSTSTTRDGNSKAALEAAEAGLQVAAYRLNKLKPEETQCISTNANIAPTSGYCTETTAESLGNGATFQYTTTPALAAGKKCAGQTIATVSGIAQRCITSEGVVSSVKPGVRLQTRVESSVGESLFAIQGILGLEEVLVNGSVKATAMVASNLKIKGEGSAAFEKGFELCPGGTFKPAAGSERNHSGVTVGGVGGMLSNPPLEKTRSASACPIVAKIPTVHPTATENQDIRISNGEDAATKLSWNMPVYSGPPKYELELGSESQLTLGGSKYYFCKLLANRNGLLKIAPKVKTEIFIDSHANNPECATSAGTFTIEGNAHLENPNGASNLLIEMAGKGPLKILNSGSLSASIYAPEAEIILSGAGVLTGAVVGAKIHLEAGSFIYSEESATLTAGSGGGAYNRRGWVQCSGTGATPETGC